MQPPNEPELNFHQVKQQINLVDLVLTLGYEPHRTPVGPSLAKSKFRVFNYRGKAHLDQVIIYRAPSGDHVYFNRVDDRDKGTVIDFLKNRLENPRIAGIRATPGQSLWGSVLDNARRFLLLPERQRKTSSQLQQTMEAVQRGDQYVPDFLLQTRPLTDMDYLRARGLTPETLASDCFQGRILNHLHEGITKQGQPYRLIYTAFPLVYHDKIVGLEIKARRGRENAADSLNSSALWLSNSGAKTTTLLVTERAIDALSHYQVKPSRNTMYASTSGQLTDNQVAELRRLITDQNIKTVKLGFDNDVPGHVQDTRLITGLAHLSAPMRVEHTSPGMLTVSIYSDQDHYFSKLQQQIKGYNQQLTEGYYHLAGQKAPSTGTLQSELILAAKEADNSYKFHIPKRGEALEFFNRALIHSYPMSVKLEVDKPRALDRNNQLRESLRDHSPAGAPSREASKPVVPQLRQEEQPAPAVRRRMRR